jgi:hypothetical protein
MPNPEKLSYYIIPEGKEDDWKKAAAFHAMATNENLKSGWALAEFKKIHGEKEEEGKPMAWKDIIHGLEITGYRANLQQAGLESLVKDSLWRTVWCSQQAKDALDKNFVQAIAISFVQEEAPPKKGDKPKSGEKDDKDDKDKDGKGKMGTLGRKIGQGTMKLGRGLENVFRKSDH